MAHPGRVARLVILNSFPCFGPQARLMAALLPSATVRVLDGHGICLIAPDLDLGDLLDEWRGGVSEPAGASPETEPRGTPA